MSKLAIVAMILLPAFGDGQPLFAEGPISEPRCVRGRLVKRRPPTLSDSAGASVNEYDFRIDIPRETAVVVATPLPLLSCGLPGEIDCV